MSSACAPGSAASTSASSAPTRPRARSRTSRSTPSASASSSTGCWTASWTLLRSLGICDSSTPDRGMASWIASWRATPASRSAWLASAADAPIPATSGLRWPASWPNATRRSSFLRTWPGISGLDVIASSARWTAWATSLRRHCAARRTSAPHIAGSGCSCWPTPQERDHKSGMANRPFRPHAPANLLDDVALWATPSTTDHKGSRRPGQRRGQLSEQTETRPLPGLPDPAIPPAGPPSSPDGPISRRLSPRFVEWLMGLPLGWTEIAPPASAPSGTPSSPRRRPSRGASAGASSLATDAPPAPQNPLDTDAPNG